MAAPLRQRWSCTILLYVLASPVFLIRGVFTLMRFIRLWRIGREGYVDCPHCRTENAIVMISRCPRCKTIEYGSRLRCSRCGFLALSFPCDQCGVTIHCY